MLRSWSDLDETRSGDLHVLATEPGGEPPLDYDVRSTARKLRTRVRRIVETATGASRERVDEALAASDGSAKVAIVSLLAEVDAEEARSRLAAAGGSIRRALLPATSE